MLALHILFYSPIGSNISGLARGSESAHLHLSCLPASVLFTTIGDLERALPSGGWHQLHNARSSLFGAVLLVLGGGTEFSAAGPDESSSAQAFSIMRFLIT